jgi:hypothetical protein
MVSLMDSPALHCCSHNSFLPAADNPPGRPSLGTADLTPSAGTLHSDQDLTFVTEIGRLLDACNIKVRPKIA